MWAAANYGGAHRDKRRRAGVGGTDVANAAADGSGSESESDISSDGERSTTESVCDQPAGVDAAQTAQGDAAHQGADVAHQQRRRKRKRRKKRKVVREETPEATVARLKASYAAAMAAVGALHQASRQYCASWKLEEEKKRRVDEGRNDVNSLNEAQSDYFPVDSGDTNNQGGEGSKQGGDDTEMEEPKTNAAGNPPGAQSDGKTVEEKMQQAQSSIQRVATAARTALEKSLLLDHVILAPMLIPDKRGKKRSGGRDDIGDDNVVEGTASAWLDTFSGSSDQSGVGIATAENCQTASNAASRMSMAKWSRLGPAHRTVVRQISYLALVNYADLLLCGCMRSISGDAPKKAIVLDRGAVPPLDVLQLLSTLDAHTLGQEGGNGHSSGTLWSDESAERTVRLALAAYCDASELDPTDPTLWFKAACAARALGREVKSSSGSSYRRLERLALERGASSLPRGVPPNRLLARALKEMEADDETVCLDAMEGATSREEDEPLKLVLHLPRHSWATLGGMLMRACREGALYGRLTSEASLRHAWSTNCRVSEDYEFGSPLVVVRVSHLLALPSTVLRRVCDYLSETPDVRNLTCTCREMSTELASARDNVTEERKTSPVSEGGNDSLENDGVTETGDDGGGVVEGADAGGPLEVDTDSTPASRTGDGPTPPRRGRVSRRVRSQLITSGKQTERKYKRSSVEYCLLAGVLSCTARNPRYTKLKKTAFDWESLPLIRECMQKLPLLFRRPVDDTPAGICTKRGSHPCPMDQTNTFYSLASLSSFVAKWSGHNSGPRDFLEAFLVHISRNTEIVFDAETRESLSSCVIDCFTVVVGCADRHSELAWYGPETFQEKGRLDLSLEVIAVNLLNAELRMRRLDVGTQDHQEDSDLLAFVVSTLLQFVSTVSQPVDSDKVAKELCHLHCRCHWLATSYYLWISRRSTDTSISQAAEDLAHTHLQQCSERLQAGGALAIRTPHLESPGRRGNHWSVLSPETLSSYREHLESSSIVSRARQSYQEITMNIQERDGDAEVNSIAAEDKAKLATLGIELLPRYNPEGETSSDALEELLNDFLLLHEENLLANKKDSLSEAEYGEIQWGEIWCDIPSSNATAMVNASKEVVSRPAILQVLAASLIASEEKIPSLFLLHSKVALTALLLRAKALNKGSGSDLQTARGESKDGRLAQVGMASPDAEKRNHLLTLAVNFFVDKLTDMIVSHAGDTGVHDVLSTFLEGDYSSIIYATLNAPGWHQNDEPTPQLHLFQSVSRLVLALRKCEPLQKTGRERVESCYIVALVKALIRQRKIFADLLAPSNDKRLKKWQSCLASNADLTFLAANEIAELLSQNTSYVKEEGSVEVSHLMKAITGTGGDEAKPATASPLVQLSESLLYLHKFLNDKKSDASSPAENAARGRLRVPISAAIISLCGSLGSSVECELAKTGEEEDNHTLTFSDYFNSEDSVNGLFLPKEREQQRRRVILRSICQLVQCVVLVYGSVDEKTKSQGSAAFPSNQHGPFLPLVTVRVLSSLSKNIFELFSESVESVYPYGARECGNAIDSLLGKAYWPLFGFSFSSVDPDTTKKQAPESLEAAWQMYRCIKRVYRDNRRSPPRKGFETVELALPTVEESKVGKAIKAFLFDANKNTSIRNVATDLPSGFPAWVLNEVEDVCNLREENQDSIELLRRHVTRELAKDPINHLDSSQQASSEDGQGLSEEREMTQSHEISLHQKFLAVLDDLTYNPKNVEGWINLSESLGFKADIISDRLVPIQESYDSSDFCLSSMSKSQAPATMNLDELKKFQEEEYTQSRLNWMPFIGGNLEWAMEYAWSNMTSLQAFAKNIGSTISQQGPGIDGSTDDESEANSDYQCWKDIESKFEKGDYALWANAWAGMFIFALRTMKVRALLVARYIAKQNLQGSMHPSEVSEDLGTALYGDLMASTVYGYPMHPMTQREKREIGERAKYFFREAIDLSAGSSFAQKSSTISWEVQFMIGKCLEKVASTLKEERYPEGGGPARLYEKSMADAIKTYAQAFQDAKKTESSSSWTQDKVGGSSHGSLECLYRLHASRFKALLSAIKRVGEECELAELEAHRIASLAWFDESNSQSSTAGFRGTTFDIYVDCVDALYHCRKEVPLFHRAAYRLAQAYHWAPAFHDPKCNLSHGSKQAIPAIKSYRIKGLEAGSCAKSANSVMSKLFEKRRGQLCAVWMTTSAAPTPFEVLNDSFRKYDALRLKYIRAYIDCMRLAEQKDKIEALLNLVTTSNQDLPSFYEASAYLRGGDPGKHAKQSLLLGSGEGFITKVKRTLSGTIAETILDDLSIMKKSGVDNEGKAKLIRHLKQSFSLFQRLNSSNEEIAAYLRRNKLPEVEAFCKCYLSIQSGYRISSVRIDGMDGDSLCSILDGAVTKAKTVAQREKATKKEKDK